VGGVLAKAAHPHEENPMQAWTRTFLLLALALAGCADPSRSRNTADPHVPALALAQQVCSNCHGMTGVSTSPTFPNLAGQRPAYLLAQLEGFKSHAREDPAGVESMWGISRSLGEEQMRGLADYYAAQAPAAPLPPPRNGDIAHGGQIYREGLPDHGVPACASCHGATGQGSDAFPRLAAQHAPYVVRQLTVFKETNQRPGGAVMKTVAHDLQPQDIRDVAAFVQTLGG
jgi:cytochrome c553